MESKKINQLATEMSPAISDLTIIGDPITGVSKKITLLQIADLFQTTGTVTSVAVTESGNALSITGSPITTAGTINIGFAGSANQYVRGDGALAPFPTSSGGGSSVSYYLNGSVNQGTFGGSTYYQMSKDAVIGVGTNFSTSSNGLIAQFITDANDPDVVQIPSGNWNIEFFMNVSASSGSLASFYVEIYKYNGSTFTLLATNSATPEELTNTTTVDAYYTSVAMPTSALSVTDRLAIRIYANVASKTVTLYTEDNRLCQVVTTFSKGMSSLNNLTDQSQFLATGTSGTDFAIASSGDTHTFNLPVASATNTGKLSSTDWSTFNGKQPAGNYVTLDTTQTITAAKTFTGVVSSIADTNAAAYILQGRTSDDLAQIQFKNNAGSNTKALISVSSVGTNGGAIQFLVKAQDLPIVSSLMLSPYQADFETSVTSTGSFRGTSLRILNNTFTGIIDASLTATRNYTLPDASGTLALTSNLTSYVPYTGATANVDLGTYSLSAGDISASNLNAIGLGTQCGYLFLKQGTAFLSGALGYSSINASATKFLLTANVSASNNKEAIFELGSLTNNTQRTFTLPDLSGTIALLEGTQTFSGNKTFSALTAFTFANGTRMDYGLYLSKGAVPSAFTSLTTNIYSDATTNNIVIRDNSSIAKLDFNNSTQTYTFPAATGTIALTSNLSAYLPLTGGTLTGALSGTSATFSGIVSSIVSSGSTSFRVINADNSRTWSLIPSTNAAESDLWLYYGGTGAGTKVSFVNNGNVLIGSTTDNGSRLQVTGAATFSSSVQIGGTTGADRLNIENSGTASYCAMRVIHSNSTADFYVGTGGSAVGNTALRNNAYLMNAGASGLALGTSDAVRMFITSGGNVGIGTSSPAKTLDVYNSANTNTAQIKVGDGGSTARAYLGTFSNNLYLSCGGTYASGWTTDGTNGIANIGMDAFNGGSTITFATAASNTSPTERMRITSGGNVGIGNTGSSIIRLLIDGVDNTSSNYGLYVQSLSAGATMFIRNDGYGYLKAAAWAYGSDRRIKENIIYIESGLDKVMALKPATFDYIDGVKNNIGWIAQDVQEVIPEAVGTISEDNDQLTLKSDFIVPYLVKAIQELSTELNELKTLIAAK